MIYYTAKIQNVKDFFTKIEIFSSGLIIELDIVNADGIALFDAHLLQAVKEPALPQLAVKIHPGLVIVEVDIRDQAFQPGAGHQPQAVLRLDGDLVHAARLRQGLHILRLHTR